ncbi:TPA: conjugal transfer protein TraN [Vibrio mimicus]|uniref:conjugal transfer protein TraN n=1 Tax=Vibrio cholerae TaxID=666 RepID=UPI00383FBCE8
MKGKLIYLFWLALLVPSLAYSNIFDQSNPARWVCGSDLNGNGYLGEEGETAACIGNAPSNYCPIGSAVCTVESDHETVAPSCKSGLSPVNGVCKEVKVGCYFDNNAYLVDSTDWTSGGARYEARIFDNTCSNSRGYQCSPTGSYDDIQDSNPTLQSSKFWRGNLRESYLFDRGSHTCGRTINFTRYPASAQIVRRGIPEKTFFNPSGSFASWCLFPADMQYAYEICTNIETIEYPTSCPSGFTYNSSKKICERGTTRDVCPLGNQYQCVANGAAKYCSPNKCVDKTDSSNEEVKDVDGNMLVDDGKRNDQGLCLDQVYIYNGRGQRCLKSGIETAFQNCCKDKGKVFQDGAGAYSSIGTASQTISGLYSVAEMAYVTYSAQTAAGVSSAFAAELAASAAQQQLLIAFDPTTIAISVAMHFVMEWVMNACDQMDMETAMAHSSGYCVEVGEYCKKKIKFIGCVQKARSFCCFNSKLARIIQEQGRPQLTTVNGFGTPSEPNCRGFTPEEFQRIDFAKIDLGEYIEELQKHTQEQVQQNIQQVTEDFFNKVK